MQQQQPQQPLGYGERTGGTLTILQVIAQEIEDLVQIGERTHFIWSESTLRFNGQKASNYPLALYLNRISDHSGCSNESFVLLYIYLRRLADWNKIVINRLNVHRLIITAAMLAAKFFDDQFYFNPYFAVVGGIPKWEINLLELEFLFLISFKLHVTREEFEDVYSTLSSRAYDLCLVNTPNQVPDILPSPVFADEPWENDEDEVELFAVEIKQPPPTRTSPQFVIGGIPGHGSNLLNGTTANDQVMYCNQNMRYEQNLVNRCQSSGGLDVTGPPPGFAMNRSTSNLSGMFSQHVNQTIPQQSAFNPYSGLSDPYHPGLTRAPSHDQLFSQPSFAQQFVAGKNIPLNAHSKSMGYLQEANIRPEVIAAQRNAQFARAFSEPLRPDQHPTHLQGRSGLNLQQNPYSQQHMATNDAYLERNLMFCSEVTKPAVSSTKYDIDEHFFGVVPMNYSNRTSTGKPGMVLNAPRY